MPRRPPSRTTCAAASSSTPSARHRRPAARATASTSPVPWGRCCGAWGYRRDWSAATGRAPPPAASSAAAPSVGNPHKPLVSLPPTASSSGGGASGPAGWLLGFAIVLAVAVVLGLAALAWWPRPRSLGGVWRRLAVAGRMVGVRPDPAETRRDFVGRPAHALGGGGPPLVAGEIEMVAALTGKAEFSP